MHRSGEPIGAIASALVKAQGELSKPENSLLATIPLAFATRSGSDLSSRPIGQLARHRSQEPPPARDRDDLDHSQMPGKIHPTPMLAHASGVWILSDWPVCPVSDVAAPHRIGTGRQARRMIARVIPLVIHNHPHRSLANLR